MNRKRAAQILLILSIALGVTIALLGAFDSPAVATVAIIGALAIGGMWAVWGIVFDRDQ